MSSPHLTIRNLSPRALVIQTSVVPVRSHATSAFGRLHRNLTGLFNGTHAQQEAAESNKAQCAPIEADFDTLRLEGYTDCKTRIDPKSIPADQIVKVTVRDEHDNVWELELPSSSATSSKHGSSLIEPLEMMTSGSKKPYMFQYLPALSVLAVSPYLDPRSWMRDIPDSTLLSHMSIPGTHNAATCFHALPSVRCQAVSPTEQLENGIRFFDLRLQVVANPSDRDKSGKNKTLTLTHGVIPISLTWRKYLGPLLDTVEGFLSNHPSETVIVCLKREGTGSHTDQDLGLLLEDYIPLSPVAKYYTEPRIPRLGEARGKIVLMRRFQLVQTGEEAKDQGQRGWGLDANGWAYNTRNQTCGHVCVQDVCELKSRDAIEEKVAACIEHFERAGRTNATSLSVTTEGQTPSADAVHQPIFLNFLSASNLFVRGCWPEDVAVRLNSAILEWLCVSRRDGSVRDDKTGHLEALTTNQRPCLGIAVCDWVGRDGNWDLVWSIIASNVSLLSGS